MSKPIEWDALGRAVVDDLTLESHDTPDGDWWEVSYRGDLCDVIVRGPDRNVCARVVWEAAGELLRAGK